MRAGLMVFDRWRLQNRLPVFCHRADLLRAMGLQAPSVLDQMAAVSESCWMSSRS